MINTEQLAIPTLPSRPGMSEADLQTAVRDLARLTGWLCYHTHDSRRSDAGFPDLTMVHIRQRRLLFVELKTAKGRLSAAQAGWLDSLSAVGIECAIWRPADLATTIPAVLRGAPLPRPADTCGYIPTERAHNYLAHRGHNPGRP